MKGGITLVALIVTIIVLIILAVVTIKGILDHNLIGTTTESIEKYDNAQKQETKMLNDIYDILDNTIKGLGTGITEEQNNPKSEKPAIINVTSIGTSETTASITVETVKSEVGIILYKFYVEDTLNKQENGTNTITVQITGLTTGNTNACKVIAIDEEGNESEPYEFNVATKLYKWELFEAKDISTWDWAHNSFMENEVAIDNDTTINFQTAIYNGTVALKAEGWEQNQVSFKANSGNFTGDWVKITSEGRIYSQYYNKSILQTVHYRNGNNSHYPTDNKSIHILAKLGELKINDRKS